MEFRLRMICLDCGIRAPDGMPGLWNSGVGWYAWIVEYMRKLSEEEIINTEKGRIRDEPVSMLQGGMLVRCGRKEAFRDSALAGRRSEAAAGDIFT